MATAEQPVFTAEQQALIARWDGFLAKIDERLREILAEAEAGVREIIATYPEDVMPLGNALSGLRFRVDELRVKVNDTWDKQVNDKFNAHGGAFQDVGLDKRQDYLQHLSEAWDLFEARMQAEFYRQLEPRVAAAAQKPVTCRNCGGTLTVANRAEAVTIKCPFCGAVNQVLAATAAAIYQMSAGHALGQEASLPLRHELERWRIVVDRQRRASSGAPESIESMDKWFEMERAVWEKYGEAKAAATGGAVDREFIESRVSHFEEHQLLRDQRWRKAKGL